MLKVIKRDDSIVEFNIDKIKNAIEAAFKSSKTPIIPGVVDTIALMATSDFTKKIKDDKINIEDIQDSVERSLMKTCYTDVAREYITYRNSHANIRDVTININNVINKYVNLDDWRVKENSTVSYSVGGLILSNSGIITANYWLSEVYDKEIADAHKNCDIHIHDLSILGPYCAGWSLKQLIKEGLGGVNGKITSKPAKHLNTLCNQMVNFLGILQNEWAGAQAFSSFDTYLAPFVKTDNLSYKETKQAISSFIFGINTPSRWGSQAPFTNVTIDWTVPNDMKLQPAIVGGVEQDFTYGDCKREMDMINKAFLELMIEGDANGRGFQYPIPTYSITKDFDWSETENNKLLFEMAAKYGTPYFSNYINSDMSPSDVRSMCCRLRLDLRELRKKSGGYFGSGENTGSIGVVSINIPRLAYKSKNEEDFYKRLDDVMDIAARSLDKKRKFVTRLFNNNFYPYTKRYLTGGFDNHFSTIAYVGGNEGCLNSNWIKSDISSEKGKQFNIDVLNHMRNRLIKYQELYGNLFNLEAAPAESTAYRFAMHDKEDFPSIISANSMDAEGNYIGDPFYTNSTNLPVGYTDDIFKALDHQDDLQVLYSSGTVFHAFLGERINNWKVAAELVKTIANNYKLPYYTISPTYSICKEHGYIVGEVYECPKCKKPTEVYSRITGYYRPVQNWNNGKVSEFKLRKEYNISNNNVNNNKKSIDNIANKDKEIFRKYDGKSFILLSTTTCPNCKIVKKYLENNNIQFELVDNTRDDFNEMLNKFNVSTAPTLVIQYINSNEYTMISGIDNILDYFKYSL